MVSKQVFTKSELTFLLRGIDKDDMAKKYNEGYFKNVTKKQVNKLVTIGDDITYDNTKPIYYDSKSFDKCIIVSSNYEMFDNFEENSLPIKGKCHWCLIPITVPPIGIPVKCVKYKDKYVFFVDGCYCSFPCCYSGVKSLTQFTYRNDKPLYKNSEQLLLFMFELNYPGKKLKEAPDWKLLIENGGSLTRDKFFDFDCLYHKIPNYLIPIKTRYIIQKNV